MIALSNEPVAQLIDAMAEAWHLPPRVDRATWCQDNIQLPLEFSAGRGRFDLTDYPWARGILEAVDDPEVETIAFKGGTQIGKTTILHAILLSQSRLEPAPMMFAGPDQDFVREHRDKIYATCDASEEFKNRVPPVHLRNDRWLDLDTCYCYLAWSGNPQRLSGKPCRSVLCSEIDRWKESPREGHTSELVAERVKAFHRFLIFYEGTPTDEHSTIEELYRLSDRRRFMVPCPRCNWWQELRIFPHKQGKFAGRGGILGLQTKDGEWVSANRARRRAYYCCERGCKIHDIDKADMNSAGIWVPRGQRVVGSGILKGNPRRDPTNTGFAINSVYAHSLTFGRIAAKYLRSRDSEKKLQNFINNWCGLKFSGRQETPKWFQLGRRLAGAHPRGKVPASAVFLTAGVDKQTDRCYWVVRAWGIGGSSWLVDYGCVVQDYNADGLPIPGSDLAKLEPILITSNWPLVMPNAAGETAMQIRRVAVDSGHKPLTVWNWVRKQPGDRVFAIRGNPNPQTRPMERRIVEKNARTGKPYPGGMKQWVIDTHVYKGELQEKWGHEVAEPGAWLFFDDPIHQAAQYLRQIANERYQAHGVKKGKRFKKEGEWVMIQEAVGNHYWDCEVYQKAIADHLVGYNWDNCTFTPIDKSPPRRPREQSRSSTGRRSLSRRTFNRRR